MTLIDFSKPLSLTQRTLECAKIFTYTEHDKQTLIEKGVICTDISDYPEGRIIISGIHPSKEILALYLALTDSAVKNDEELYTILKLIIKRDASLELKQQPQPKDWLMYEIKLTLNTNGQIIYFIAKIA